MDKFLYSLVGEEYRETVDYKKEIKELNEILDIILYLCNNVNYERIKKLCINLIENNDYYNEPYDISNVNSQNIETDDILKYIKDNQEDIIKQIEKLKEKYKIIEKYEKQHDYDDQQKFIENKFENIKNLDIFKSDGNEDNEEDKEEDNKEDIKFNIILIDKNSSIYSNYKFFKKYLFKNLHCIEELIPENELEFNNDLKNEYYKEISKILKEVKKIFKKVSEQLNS